MAVSGSAFSGGLRKRRGEEGTGSGDVYKRQHLNMIISSRPGTPDRTRYILGLSDENPAPVMIDAGRWLVAEGAEILAIPCITAHYFQKQLEEEIHTPVIHLIKETVHHMRDYRCV